MQYLKLNSENINNSIYCYKNISWDKLKGQTSLVSSGNYNIKRKTMKNIEDIVLTLIIITMTFLIGNLYKRVQKLEDKLA